jgi:hypothetical protein
MKTFLLFLAITLLIAASGTVSASQGSTITLNPPGVTLLPGSTVTYVVGISTLPAGLSDYQLDFKLTNPSAGSITKVSFPAWAKLSKTSSLPAGQVSISARDLGKAIEDGAAGTTLVSITVEAVAAGNSNVKMSNITIDDDHGGYINPDSPTAQLVVKQGGIAVTTTAPAPNITGTPTVSTTTGVVSSSTTVKTPTTLLTTAQTPVEISVTSNIPSDPSVTAATPASLIAKFPRWMLYAAGLIALVAGLSLLVLAVTRKI